MDKAHVSSVLGVTNLTRVNKKKFFFGGGAAGDPSAASAARTRDNSFN